MKEVLASTHEWVRMPNENEAAEQFAADIESVIPGGKVYTYSSEANPGIYNHAEVTRAFKKAKHRRKAEVVVIAGPIAIIQGGFNGLVDLRNREAEVYFRPVRGATAHFHIVQVGKEKYRYCEEYPHSARRTFRNAGDQEYPWPASGRGEEYGPAGHAELPGVPTPHERGGSQAAH